MGMNVKQMVLMVGLVIAGLYVYDRFVASK